MKILITGKAHALPCVFLKKMGHPRPLSVYFRLFKQALQFLQQINVKKCQSSIGCWDSNPQPLEHDSSPITTRPGLPPFLVTKLGYGINVS